MLLLLSIPCSELAENPVCTSAHPTAALFCPPPICSLVWHWAHTPCCCWSCSPSLKFPVLTGWWRSAPRSPPGGAWSPPASVSSPAAACQCIPLSSGEWWRGWSKPNTDTQLTFCNNLGFMDFVLLTCTPPPFNFPSLCVKAQGQAEQNTSDTQLCISLTPLRTPVERNVAAGVAFFHQLHFFVERSILII